MNIREATSRQELCDCIARMDVKLANAERALTAAQARITELEAIVEAVSHLSAESYSPWADVIRVARAALSPKEPA